MRFVQIVVALSIAVQIFRLLRRANESD